VLAEPEEHAIWKVGCADAVPITQKQVLKRSGEPYAVKNGTYWFREGGTGDPAMGDRPLLYRLPSQKKEQWLSAQDQAFSYLLRKSAFGEHHA